MNTQAAAVLSARGVRPTPQRVAVYDYLLGHRTHPSAETIYQALQPHMPALSLTTVYNCLAVLAQAGLIRTVTIRPQEQRFDAGIEDHGHFYCNGCGQIFDFEVDEALLRALCPAGFTGGQEDVYVTGFCPDCAPAENT